MSSTNASHISKDYELLIHRQSSLFKKISALDDKSLSNEQLLTTCSETLNTNWIYPGEAAFVISYGNNKYVSESPKAY